MSERNVYIVPEDKVLLRTADVYQTEGEDDIDLYSEKLLSIVADFTNSGKPEGYNAQSMVGKSKKGEVACRLFAVIDPDTQVVQQVGFKTRGCLAMTGCASAICTMIEGKDIVEVLDITPEDVRDAVDGVPAGKINTIHFAPCAVRALVGDYLVDQGATLQELNNNLPCDESSISCIMAEHCSLRSTRTELRVKEQEAKEQLDEQNALAEAFDLIRERTRSSKLTSKDDLKEAGLIPPHLSKKQFAVALDAIVVEDMARQDTQPSTDQSEPGKEATERKTHSKFANRGVGIPNKMKPASMPDTVRAIEVEEIIAPSEDDTEEATFDDLELPEGCTLEEIDGEWVLVQHIAPGSPKEQKAQKVEAAGIKRLEGKEGQIYYFDGSIMTDKFAHWAYLASEDDPVFTFADCVREESRLYPRPMSAVALSNDPFCMDEAQVMDAYERSQDSDEYADIHLVRASNGDAYFYSDRHMEAALAQSLAELDGVERLKNV